MCIEMTAIQDAHLPQPIGVCVLSDALHGAWQWVFVACMIAVTGCNRARWKRPLIHSLSPPAHLM